MTFDITTAKPVKPSGFDLSTAKPVNAPVMEPQDNIPQENNRAAMYPMLNNGYIAELAASANRSVTEFVDFLGPNAVNSIARLAKADWSKGVGDWAPTEPDVVPTLTGAMEPTGIQGNFMDEGYAKETMQALGKGVTMAGGMYPVARNLQKVGPMVADFLGIGATKNPATVVPGIIDRITGQPAKQKQKMGLLRNTGDVDTAHVKLEPPTPEGIPKVVADKTAKEVSRQGINPGLVAQIKASPKRARQKFSAMVDVVKKGKENTRFQADNRPLDVVGESVLDRVKVVREANRAAGVRINHVAKSLKGTPVKYTTALDDFYEGLEDAGILYDPATGKASFDLSDFDDIPAPMKAIERTLARIYKVGKTAEDGMPDAYLLHRMKRHIDEVVTYGSDAGGLKGQSERMLKKFRHDINTVLGENFPEYKKVNKQYSETVDVLDELQDIAGKKMDLGGDNAASALGTLSRRILSNAQSRVPLKDAINRLDTVAKKYISPGSGGVVPHTYIMKKTGVTLDMLDDDIGGQAIFADELEKIFGTHARTSLQGDVAKPINRAVELSQKTGVGMTAEAINSGYNFVRGVNEDGALKAITELLEELK